MHAYKVLRRRCNVLFPLLNLCLYDLIIFITPFKPVILTCRTYSFIISKFIIECLYFFTLDKVIVVITSRVGGKFHNTPSLFSDGHPPPSPSSTYYFFLPRLFFAQVLYLFIFIKGNFPLFAIV